MIKKRRIGFGAYDNEQEPQEQESRVDYVQMALDEYLKPFSPCGIDEATHLEFMTSKEIKENISEIVTASISTITDYMVEHGYKLYSIKGERIVWLLNRDEEF